MKVIGVVVLVTFPFFLALGQHGTSHSLSISIQEVALVDISPVYSSKTNQAHGLKGVWVNYSSVYNHQKQRSIKMYIENADESKAIYATAHASQSGYGQLGQPAGPVKLSDHPQTVIGGIGTAYTESGNQKGHLVEFAIMEENHLKPIDEFDDQLSIKLHCLIVED